MNRSLSVTTLAIAEPDDEVVAAASFRHPDHGAMACPAAPLLAAAFGERSGRRAVPVGDAVVTPDGPGLLAAASYLDRAGNAFGFGIAVRDAAAFPAAAATVAEWVPVLRSRRLIIADDVALCAGAARAARMITATAEGADSVRVVGEPLASDADLTAWRARGGRLEFADNLDGLGPGTTVVWPAQGAPLAVRAEAAALGLTIVDAACPLATAAQADARSYADRGDTVLVVGDPKAAAASSFAQQAPESTITVATESDVRALPELDPDRVSFVVQTGTRVETAARVIAALRLRFPHLRGHHYDALCYAASDQADTVRATAHASDVVLVLGRTGHPDTDRLAEAASRYARVYPIAGAGELRPSWLLRADTVGLVATRSAGPGLAAQLTAVLSGLGPLSVVRRGSRTASPADDRMRAASPS